MRYHHHLSKRTFCSPFYLYFRREKLLKMNQNITFWPRQAFCWLDEKNVIVVSKDNGKENGDCRLLNTVSLFLVAIFYRF